MSQTNTQGLNAGQTLQEGKYRIAKELGHGSFGITYLAKTKLTSQLSIGTINVEADVAIKEFFMSDVNCRRSDGNTVEGSAGSVFVNYRRKFKKEAENLAKLHHPNIVNVYDVFDENNTTYYVMEFLAGSNLDEYISKKGHLSEGEAISFIKEIGCALSYMHSQKMLHLDVKPKNVMIKPDGKVCLIDFGLSKQFTEDGEPESSTSIGLGTPGYAPIEQSGYKQDGTFPATLDVYALGASLYKMLTGKRPPEATNILNEGFPESEFQALGISEKTIAALVKAMAPTKKKRYQDVESFLNELDDAENEETTIIGTTRIVIEPDPEPDPEPKPKPHPEPKPEPDPEPEHPTQPHGKAKNRSWIGYVVAMIPVVLLVGWRTCSSAIVPEDPQDYQIYEDSVMYVDSVMYDESELDYDSAYYDDSEMYVDSIY